MDLRYYNYLMGDKVYYQPYRGAENKNFSVNKPDGWLLNEGTHWINLMCKRNEDFPSQGWKIHISTKIENAQQCLAKISKYLFKNYINFKYVKNEFQLILKNSKNAPREASGKFITIYPKDVEEFKKILVDLENLLSDMEKGPYILSDRRWKDSNIYYRYGGFVERKLDDGKYGIVNNKGQLVEDLRLPFYNIPNWVEVPDFIKENEIEVQEETPLSNYDILGALHFSNSGGVYEANDKRSGKKCIIKEARPNAGLDGNGDDAVFRLKKEYSIMNELKHLESVADVYEIFKAWEHYFVVMEYVEGDSLSNWIVANYPLARNYEKDSYIENLYNIAEKCCIELEKIHKMGVAHGDIQPRNIIITKSDNEYKVKFIDFETAGRVGVKGEKSLGTPGYFDNFNDYSEQKDWTGMLRIFKNSLISVMSLEVLANNVFNVHYNWIKENFGEKAVAILDNILNYAKDERYDIRYSADKLFSLKNDVDYKAVHTKMKENLKKELFSTNGHIHGDIKQFEYPYGKVSFGYGSLGAVLLLYRLGESIPKDILKNVQKKIVFNSVDGGLYSGLSGIGLTLEQLGEKEASNNIWDFLFENKELLLKTTDVSLESGLAGLGLAMLDMFIEKGESKFLDFSLEIYEKIKQIYDTNPELITTNSGLTSDGLMYGWSGVSLYSFGLYNILKEEKHLIFAKETLAYELEKFKDVEGMSLLKIKDNRLMPYFSIGSTGLIFPILFMKKYLEESIVKKTISGILETVLARPCVCAGLFEGYLGLIYVAKYIDYYYMVNGENTNYKEEVLKNLNQYLLFDKEDKVYLPGNYSLRLSFDMATGLAGGIVTLRENNLFDLEWLPVKNRKKLFDLN